ncbi:NADH:flavin oxidoreductase [Vandammella animalimorsus]|uniref:oxidoreductase n=1 Tax=Vandammella animalimorsus TaxID=2029117 RepID=UPI0031BA4574
MRDPRYDILFEPVRIGPVTTRNRFYQVPHCSGMGHRHPAAEQRLRQIKAEGGWGVVSTQETEIHPSSDISPSNQQRLWDERDIGRLQALTEAIHAHGSLAAIQLAHNGIHTANRLSRIAPYGPADMLVDTEDPVQARAMDKSDIRAFRQWHRDAALRAKRAGFDIVYVYAGHDMTLLQHFLLKRYNQRSDEYGGSFENRLRLFREVLADTREAVGDACAVAVRFAVEELLGQDGLTHDGEGRDVIAALADEPDLWDVNLSNWANDSQTARFAQEGFQEPYTAFVKSLTRKPVVGVGRYTSPDAMVRAIRSGILDLVGAARPSIADPFLPQKIEQGRIDEIRECIGCNICTAGDTSCPCAARKTPPSVKKRAKAGTRKSSPRCRARPRCSSSAAAPPGWRPRAPWRSAARSHHRRCRAAMGRARQPGGAPAGPGHLGARARLALGQLRQASNVQMYLDSPLSAQDVLAFGMAHVAIATGAHWRCDGVGRVHRQPCPFWAEPTPRAWSASIPCSNRGAAAVHAALAANHAQGAPPKAPWSCSTTTATTWPACWPSCWRAPGCRCTSSPPPHRRALERTHAGATTHPPPPAGAGRAHHLAAPAGRLAGRSARTACTYSGRLQPIACACLVPVTARLPNNSLWQSLQAASHSWAEHGIASVERIGDCLAPASSPPPTTPAMPMPAAC